MSEIETFPRGLVRRVPILAAAIPSEEATGRILEVVVGIERGISTHIHGDVEMRVVIHRVDSKTGIVLIVWRVKGPCQPLPMDNSRGFGRMDCINVNRNSCTPFPGSEDAVDYDRFRCATGCDNVLYVRAYGADLAFESLDLFGWGVNLQPLDSIKPPCPACDGGAGTGCSCSQVRP